jgi:hypothetical protein
MRTDIDQETVAELRDAVRDLLRDEDARAQSLTARATGLAGFVGVIVAVVATVWPGGDVGPSSRQGVLTFALTVTAGGAVAALVAAVIAVIVRVLLPSPGVRVATSEVERFRTVELAPQPAVVIRGDLLGAYARALIDESERNGDRRDGSRSLRPRCRRAGADCGCGDDRYDRRVYE